MAVDKLVDSAQLDSDLGDIAIAIRTKGGTSAQLTFPSGFISAIEAITTGITPTGTINITQSGNTDVTNYATANVASGSASTPATTITANPSISVSSSGLITASVSGSQSVTPTVSSGYVSSGTSGTITVSGSNTSQLTTQSAQTITPTTTAQTIASGKYLTGNQTIEGIVCTNLTAENIADGVTVKIGTATDDDSVASITGTHSGGGGGTVTITFEQMMNTADGFIVPSCATIEVDSEQPWITYIKDIPASCLFVAISAMNTTPTCSAGITFTKQRLYGSLPSYYYIFTVGSADGSISF